MTTAVVRVLNNNGEWMTARTLLDTCSTANFVTEDFARSLALPMQPCKLPVGALNSLTTKTKHRINLKIYSNVNDFDKTLDFLTIPRIAEFIPDQTIPRENFQIPANLKLADPEFHIPRHIDMLIGSGPTLSLLCIGQHKLSNNNFEVYLQKTRLGWVLGGDCKVPPRIDRASCHFSQLEKLVERFWETEELESKKEYSNEEIECIDHFHRHTIRDSSGRFIVALPFKRDPRTLGESQSTALKQLLSLQRKFTKNPVLKKQYSDIIEEYIQLGHMSFAPTRSDEGFYMPHHAVFKETSATTKVRVVFNASARTSNGISLNDTLMVGPTIQHSTFSIHLRFRLHAIALTADIEKMYRQVLVRPEDRKYQRLLWSKNGEIVELESNTVTFGNSAAPFLAIKCIQTLADAEKTNFPLAAKVLKDDIYVDDVVTGADTIEEALKIREQCSTALKAGGFHIRQWASNQPNVLKGLDPEMINARLDLDKDDALKTLGIYWNAGRDQYTYTARRIDTTQPVTKRKILSEIAKIYDPLGLLGPIILYAKVIMQKLWQGKLEWDESVSNDIYTIWTNYCFQLHMLESLSFDRNILDIAYEKIELHGFCDASESGYGACIYVRCIRGDQVTCNLYCSKSRVAPLKILSLPRLELNGAKLLVSLYNEVRNSIDLKFDKLFFWTDSTIVIHWIRTPSYALRTFTANRVSYIQSHTNAEQWRHVRSTDNPADSLSRGQLPKDFVKNSLWRHGPAWLKHDESMWPTGAVNPLDTIPELKRHTVLLTMQPKNEIFERFSSFRKLLHVLSFAFRVLKPQKYIGPLSPEELSETEMRVIRIIQASSYADEIKILKKDDILFKSRILNLNPFVDGENILRVGGRLKNSTFPYNQRHPMLLPSHHWVTDLIIRHYHESTHHGGIQTTLYALRQKFWLPDGRNQVRKIVHGCVVCFRAKPPEVQYKMGDLPSIRTNQTRPFQNTGLDYCGPFFIKEKKFRNRLNIKVWVAVFVCMVTKAVHLEVVSDMSTDAFLGALRRFIGRRGKPASISSDNGSNFIGANNELKDLHDLFANESTKTALTNFSNDNGIIWRFIPPLAPNFGGLWESQVKIFKHHLKRVARNVLFTYEQFNTLTIEIEAIINSRPLTPISNDPNDLIALTPGHFLIGTCLNDIPAPDFEDVPSNKLSVWQHLTKIKQDFWKKWNQEYINELNVRHKWSTGDHQIKQGTLVVIRDKDQPSMQWKLGRVIKTHPGPDNIVRAVSIKTAKGELIRSVKLIAPLPIEDNNV